MNRDSSDSVSRRRFLQDLGAFGGGLASMVLLGGCQTLFDAIKNRPVRRRIRPGNADVTAVLEIYKDAVAQMKALPASNPRSWAAQAAIHGTVSGGFNFCQHGTTHFFSWHRAYLRYFESICQELTGESGFGLPYWNWNQNPAMHPVFTDAASPLFHTPRTRSDLSGFTAFEDANLNTIFGDSNFFTFGDQLEGSPHDLAHVFVAGTMVTGGSPLDPIFWTHHCMIDYCWAKWNLELNNDNPNDAAWSGTEWTHFVDRNGDPVPSITAGITTLMPLLTYRYETSAIGGFAASAALTATEFRAVKKRVEKGAEVKLKIKRVIPIAKRLEARVAEPLSMKTRVAPADFAAMLDAPGASDQVLARIDFAQLPFVNDFFVRVFVNLPDANAHTSTDDPHFAGSFAFFGTYSDHQHSDHDSQGKTDFLVNITNTLQRLQQTGEMLDAEGISVQLVTVPVDDSFQERPSPEPELILNKFDLIVTPVKIRPK